MATAKIVTRARAEGLVILLVALGYAWEARRIPSLFQSPGVPGPAAFPSVLALVLALAGLWRLVRGSPQEAAAEAAEAAAEAPAAGAATPSWLAAHGRFYALWGVLLGLLAFLPELGFPVAAFAAMVLMFRLLGEKRWHLLVPLSLVVTAVLHVAFSYGLGVRLPLGILQGLLRR
jgi:hypothetical protein